MFTDEIIKKNNNKTVENINYPVEIKSIENIKNESYELPENYHWSNCDLNDTIGIGELYNLSSENYTENDKSTLRLLYSKEFLLSLYIVTAKLQIRVACSN